MITEKDLEEAIAECQGKRNPDASTCIKLAAFYTIRREMFGSEPSYSYAPPPETQIESDSEFAEAVRAIPPEEAWAIMDEMMDALQVLLPRLYDGVMRKLRAED